MSTSQATNPLDAVRRIADNRRHWFSYSRGLALGSWRRIPIYMAPSWLFVSAVLTFSYASAIVYRLPRIPLGEAYLMAAAFVVLLLASVLVHELAHALVARQFGVDVDSVTVWMLGGFTRLRREPPTPRAEFVMAAAGPLASLALGMMAFAGMQISAAPDWLGDLCRQLAVSNLTIAVFNVLPGLPLDGGAMVRGVAWYFTGDRIRATLVAARAGQGLAVVLLGFAFGLVYTESGVNPGLLLLTFLVPFFLWISASHTVRRAHMQRRIDRISLRRLAHPCVALPADTSLAAALAARSETKIPIVVLAGRVVESQQDSVAVLGVVPEAAIAATPAVRHQHMSLRQLARAVEPHHVLPASVAGSELWQAVTGHDHGNDDGNDSYGGHDPGHYVVVESDRVIGVISDAEMAHAIEPPWRLSDALRSLRARRFLRVRRF